MIGAILVFIGLIVGSAILDARDDPYVVPSFGDPTDRYPHAVLGDDIEYGSLMFPRYKDGGIIGYKKLTLSEKRVFEDIAPRAAFLEPGDIRQIVVVESHSELGAQLAVYEDSEVGGAPAPYKRAATPHIGQRNRWLAPAAIADFDGDGINDIAYVETPHLAGILKIVTLRGDELVPIATPRPGFSNHRIGQDFITSDVRICDGVTELLLPSLDWTTLMAARLVDGEITARPLPHPPSREGIVAARACEG